MNVPYHLVKLDYDPNTCVLLVEWPDFTESFYTEVQLTFDVIIDKIRSTNAKYLLSDSRKVNIGISEPKFKAFTLEFMTRLANTSIEKIARIITDSTKHEQLIKEITKKAVPKIPIRFFSSKKEALQWLTSN